MSPFLKAMLLFCFLFKINEPLELKKKGNKTWRGSKADSQCQKMSQ